MNFRPTKKKVIGSLTTSTVLTSTIYLITLIHAKCDCNLIDYLLILLMMMLIVGIPSFMIVYIIWRLIQKKGLKPHPKP